MFVRELVAIRPAAMPWKDNLRLVAPVLLALAVFTAMGSFLTGLLVGLGAYIVLFGAGQPGRRRLRTFVVVSVIMLASITCGMLASGSVGLITLAYVLAAVVTVVASIVVDIGAPGPFFFPLMVGGGALLGGSGMSVGQVVPFIVLGNVLAIAFGMADLLYDPYGSERRAVAAARSAVDDLQDAVSSGDSERSGDSDDQDGPEITEVLDGQLSSAAQGIHRAWETVLDGFDRPHNERTRSIQKDLLDAHHRYRELYWEVVGRALPGTSPDARGGASEPVDADVTSSGQVADFVPDEPDDPRRTALGEPSLGYRLATQLRWPSLILITLVRVCCAVVLAGVYSATLGDPHPF